MAHFSYIGGSLGAWAIGTTITPAKLWQWDQNQYAAINGDGGGTWSPTAKIVIGGSNGVELSSSPLLLSGTSSLTVGGAAQFNGSFAALGNVIIGTNSLNTLVVNAAASFNADATFGYLNATTNVVLGTNGVNTLTVKSSATFENDCAIGTAATDYCEINANLNIVNGCTIGSSSADSLDINATEAHYGPETHDGAETHNGAVTFVGNLTCDMTFTANGNTVIGSSIADTSQLYAVMYPPTLEGRVVPGTVFPTDADWTYGSFRSRIIYPSGLLSESRDLQISFSGAYIGDEVEIWNMSGTYYVYVKNSGGTTIGTVGGGNAKFGKIIWNGSVWVFISP